MIGRFFAWWSAGLRAWLPRAWRTRRGVRARALCLVVGDEDLVWVSEHGADGERLGSCPVPEETPGGARPVTQKPAGLEVPADGSVRIRFSAGRALVREVELPLATEENLAQVLRFEMERLTPFRAQDVYHRYAVLARDTQARVLRLRLLVVPRAGVDSVLGLLGDARLDPAPEEQAEIEGDGEMELEFRPLDYRPRRAGRLVPALIVLNAVLLVALGAVLLARQERIIERLDAQMSLAVASATRADTLRQRLESLLGAGEFLLEQRLARPAAVLLLEEISEVLPDGTSLSRLEVRATEIHVHGISTSASALIALLDESDLLSGARFASPVLRDGASGRDRFHIAAQIEASGAGG